MSRITVQECQNSISVKVLQNTTEVRVEVGVPSHIPISVKERQAEKRITVSGIGTQRTLDSLTGTAIVSSLPKYDGDYTVTPKISSQTLATKGKEMKDDITVSEIPYYEVSNASGGETIYIPMEV